MKTCGCVPLTFIALCLVGGGCDLAGPTSLSQEATNLDSGTFEAKGEGYVNRTFQGEAVFQTLYGLGGEPIFWIRLQDLNDVEGKRLYRLVDFVNGQENPPEQNIYELPAVEQGQYRKQGNFSATYQDSDVNGSVFKSLGGTLEVYASDETYVVGAFSFTAYDDVATAPRVFEKVEIVLNGTFHAIKGDVGIILN